VAESVSSVAARDGQVVGEVVFTMQGTSDSSRRIVDIIAVIDGIAFQTNILVLNAAVEAARAGEQGSGFAVVASEVRSLAQRSAQAARAIKGLIAASVEKVDGGSRLVQQAGLTMGKIVTQVGQVIALIGTISSTAREQSGGHRQRQPGGERPGHVNATERCAGGAKCSGGPEPEGPGPAAVRGRGRVQTGHAADLRSGGQGDFRITPFAHCPLPIGTR